MAESRDLNVNIRGDASGLIAAVRAAEQALQGLKAQAGTLGVSAKVVATQQMEAAKQATLTVKAETTQQTATVLRGLEMQANASSAMLKDNSVKVAAAAKVDTATRIAEIDRFNAEFKAGLDRQTNNEKAGLQMQANASKANLAERLERVKSFLRMEETEYKITADKEKQLTVLSAREAAAARLAVLKSGLAQERAQTTMSMAAGTAMMMMAIRRAIPVVKEMLGSFTDLAMGTRRLQLVMGGSAEEMSKLQFAANQVGVATEDLSARMILMETHIAKNDQYAQALGVSFKDAAGNMKPTVQQLYEVADALNRVSDPNKRIDLARNLFGRGAESILPLLAQGSDGMRQLAAEADKLGITMSGKDVQAARAFKIEQQQLHASMQALGITIARGLMPFLARLAEVVSSVVQSFRRFMESGSTASNVVKALIATLTSLVAVLVVLKVAGTAWAVVEGIITAAATPWILGVMGIIAAVVLLVQTFGPAGKVVELFFTGMGALAGGVASIVALVFRGILLAVSLLVQGLAKAARWIGDTFHIGWLSNAGKGVDHFVSDANKKLDSIIVNAPRWGANIGAKFGTALVDSIKNLKMPSLGSMIAGAGPGAKDTGLGGMDLSSLPTSGGGGGGAKSRIAEFFKTLVDTARAQLDAAVKAAQDAKKQMDDMADSVSNKFRESFSISSIIDSCCGPISTPGGLLAAFQKRLDAMRGFVGNLRKLRDLGLPPTMLGDIAAQGAEKGAALAKMLVANPSIFPQLADIQSAIETETTAAGQMVSQYVYGSQVASLIGQAQQSQVQFNTYLAAARRGGYQPTQADIDASTQNIYNMVMGVQSNADPAAIQAAIAWALRTGSMGRGGNRFGNTLLGPNQNMQLPIWLQSGTGLQGPTNIWGLQGPAVLPIGANTGLQGVAYNPNTGLQGPATPPPQTGLQGSQGNS